MLKNKRIKLSAIPLLVLMGFGVNTAVWAQPSSNGQKPIQAPQTTNQPTQAPTQEIKLDLPQAMGNNLADGTLEEISKLKAERAKLEEKKAIAKLKSEIEEIETGKKPGGLQFAQNGAPQVQLPTASEVLYDSLTLTSIYGSDKKLTAEINTSKGKIIGQVGTRLPSGETIKEITPSYILLTMGKNSRRLNPTGEDMTQVAQSNMYGVSQQMPQGPQPQGKGQMPMIQPFNPEDLMGSPTVVDTKNSNSNTDNKKATM